MEILCDKEKLLKGIISVETIVKSKLSFSHLSNILLVAEDDQFSLKVSNGEISQVANIDVEVIKPGKIVLTQSKLYNLLRQFPNGKISLSLNNKNVVKIIPTSNERDLECFLLGISPDDFPTLIDFPQTDFYVLEKSYLRKMINKVIFAVSSQPTRYALHGVFLEFDQNQITLVATDTRIMSLFKTSLTSDKNEKIGVILPYNTLLHLKKNLLDDGPVNFVIKNNQIFFKFDNYRINSSLINGEFPNYKILLPENNEKILIAKTQELINALSTSNSILDDLQAPKIIWKIKSDQLNIFSQENNYNQVNENINVVYQGDDMEIGFNSKMLLEIIGYIDTEEVEFNFKHETAPVLIKEKGRSESIFLIMPIKLNV
jgi:DNA polymerase-3 subunit beta